MNINNSIGAIGRQIRTLLTILFGAARYLRGILIMNTQKYEGYALTLPTIHLIKSQCNSSMSELNGKTSKILLVEDNPMIQFFHKQMLLDINCDVDVANDAETAFDFLKNRYDFILLDIELPGMNGIQLAKKIRFGHTINNKVKIYAITAHAVNEIIQECEMAGINKVISKPVDCQQLKNIICI